MSDDMQPFGKYMLTNNTSDYHTTVAPSLRPLDSVNFRVAS